MFIDYYAVLAVSPEATDQEIKNSYRKLARKYHPDLNQNDNEAKQKMQSINEAYNELSNSESRMKFDILYKEYHNVRTAESKRYTSEYDSLINDLHQKNAEESTILTTNDSYKNILVVGLFILSLFMFYYQKKGDTNVGGIAGFIFIGTIVPFYFVVTSAINKHSRYPILIWIILLVAVYTVIAYQYIFIHIAFALWTAVFFGLPSTVITIISIVRKNKKR